MDVNYGSHRLAVGAHFGWRDWLVQRLTAVLMAAFTLIVIFRLILSSGPIGYETWAGLFASPFMKALTFAVILGMLWHVWVGIRNIFMDYAKPYFRRLVLHFLAAVYLVACGGWAVQVLWRL